MPQPDIRLDATESRAQFFALTKDEAVLLQSLGRELASTTTWWGGGAGGDDRSVISVEAAAHGQFKVTFRDVVGVVKLPGRQIHISPKIPPEHFFHLASRSEMAPRLATSRVTLDAGSELVEVLAQWCVQAAEDLLRIGLRKDYVTRVEELSEVRGRMFELDTILQISSGRAVALCEFDDLSDDSALNRVVRGACQRLARTPILSSAVRARARRVVYRMDGVGALQVPDLRVRVERISKAYARVVPLSLLVLASCGISSSSGGHAGSAFLIRTPELIEDGIRAVLTDGLPEVSVTKKRLMLGNSGLSVNPDLIFGTNQAIGDVKYRYINADWHRSDLYQVVAFAAAFHCGHGMLVGFARDTAFRLPPPVKVGSISMACLAWVASPEMSPLESARRLSAQARHWAFEVASVT